MEAQLEEKNQELQRVCVPRARVWAVAQARGGGASVPLPRRLPPCWLRWGLSVSTPVCPDCSE